MSLNLVDGTWHCFACDVGGGLLDFERRLTGKSDVECWDAINSTIGREAPQRGPMVLTYDYIDAAGRLVYQVVRFAQPKKHFQQRRPDGKDGWIWNMDGVTRVPFNLPAVVRANVVLVSEGEKDALSLQGAVAEFENDGGKLSYATTCNAGGAGKWLDNYSPYLAGKRVFVFEDNDEPGRRHAQQVCASAAKYAQAVHLVRLSGLAEHGDVSDYLKDHTPAELFEQMRSTPSWAPDSGPEKVNPEAGGLRLVKLGEILARPVVPVDWIWQGRLVAGTVSIVAAKPKVGKSTLARNLAMAVARGEPFLGWQVKQGRVLYFCLEERMEDVALDFRTLGAGDAEYNVLLADAATALDAVNVLRDKKPVLLVVDPLFRLVNVRDERGYSECYAALGPLIDVARETGTHIMCLHHSSKLAKAEAIDSPIGSTALGGGASSILVMRRTDSYRTLQSVQRIGEDLQETVLRFDSATKRLALGGSRDDAEVQGVAARILACMDTAILSEPEINGAVEGRNSCKRRAIRELTVQGKLVRSGSGKRGDAYLYQKACSLVPGHMKNNGDKRLFDGVDTDEQGAPEKAVPLFVSICGDKSTRKQNSPELFANTTRLLVPDDGDGDKFSKTDANKLFSAIARLHPTIPAIPQKLDEASSGAQAEAPSDNQNDIQPNVNETRLRV